MSAKAAGMPRVATVTPASAGPIARAMLYVIEFSPTAEGRWRRSTSEASRADAAGTVKAEVTPSPAETAIKRGVLAAPAQASAATSPASPAATLCIAMIRRRRSKRSAALPAHGASTSTGTNWENASTPSRSSEPVSR